MSDPSLMMQIAIVAALKADAGVQAVVNPDGKVIGMGVYDNVTPTAKCPYISIGPSDVVGFDAECITGGDVTMQVDVWSRLPGFLECKQLAGLVRNALHHFAATVDGVSFEIEASFTHYMRDTDGLTSHAAISFKSSIDLEA